MKASTVVLGGCCYICYPWFELRKGRELENKCEEYR